MAKVTALESPSAPQVRRLGFLSGQLAVPDDFDRMGRGRIERRFGGSA